jgi:O-antigen/teichoic acid export membrane protein
LFSFALATAYPIIVARKIGPAGFGVLAMALAIASFLAVGSDLGLDYILRLVQIKRRLRLVPYDHSFWRPLVACVGPR